MCEYEFTDVYVHLEYFYHIILLHWGLKVSYQMK